MTILIPCLFTHTPQSQGYQDIVNEKIASAIAKLEEAGLTPEACEKFLKTYGKVKLDLRKNFEANFLISLSPQVLHPNHAHMLDIKYSYLNILGHSEGWAKKIEIKITCLS